MEPPSKKRKQEGDPDSRTPLQFSLCDELTTTWWRGDVVSVVRDVKSELLHVRGLLGVQVRREGCAETKTEIAARRLDRME